jgi:hypothetical protein
LAVDPAGDTMSGNVSTYFGITGRQDNSDAVPHLHETHFDQGPEVVRADRHYFGALAL